MGVEPQPALFVDRDGVLNEPIWDVNARAHESPLRVRDVALTKGAARSLRRLNEAGWRVIIVSNQPAAAKGAVELTELQAIHARVLELLASDGGVVQASYLCLHHPQAIVPSLSVSCDCRKPGGGLLKMAAVEHAVDLSTSWLIGDTDADVGAAHTAGLANIVLIEHPKTAHRRTRSSHAILRVADIDSAVDLFLRLVGRGPCASESG